MKQSLFIVTSFIIQQMYLSKLCCKLQETSNICVKCVLTLTLKNAKILGKKQLREAQQERKFSHSLRTL